MVFRSGRDPLDRLAVLPISRFVEKGAVGQEAWRSVKDLFFGILARPGCLLDTAHSEQRGALVLFAAMMLVAGTSVPDRAPPASYHARLLSRALDWIAPHLPSHAFGPGLEAVLGAASLAPLDQGGVR